MNSISISFVVWAIVFGGAILNDSEPPPSRPVPHSGFHRACEGRCTIADFHVCSSIKPSTLVGEKRL